MPFVPNGDRPDATDLDILLAGISGTGVISGCAVSAQGSPNMTVAVAAGVIQPAFNVTGVAVTGGNVTHTTAHNTLDRRDLVVANTSTGAVSAVAGTPATLPVYPAIPGSRVVLAGVSVPHTDTTLGAGQITDKRVMLVAWPVPVGFSAVVYKTADEVGPATTVLQNDNHLVLSGLTAGTYLVEGMLAYSRLSGSASLLKVGWTVSDASGTFPWHTGWPGGGNAGDVDKTATLTGQTSAGGKSSMLIHGVLTLTTTGSLQMTWANSTGSDPITVFKGSLLRATKVV